MKAVSKYIVVREPDGSEVIETFGTWIIHADYVRSRGVRLAAVVSAGFVSQGGECFGASSSLQKSSRPRVDTALLKQETDE